MQKKTLALVVGILTVPCLIWTFNSSSAQTKISRTLKTNPDLKVQTTPKLSPRIKAVIKGSDKPDEIPDEVAYELFLRTVAQSNARGLLLKSGLDEMDIDILVSESNNFNVFAEAYSQAVQNAKSDPRESYDKQLMDQVKHLEFQKNIELEKTINRWIPQALQGPKLKKFREFVDVKVKHNIQKILLNNFIDTRPFALSRGYAGTFAPKRAGGGQIFIYSAAWQDGVNVYGSASLYEQYSTDISYKVTVSIISPSGRTNTVDSDWSYATILNDAGLSIGTENGRYLVSTSFEEQGGYYDEYGNFFGSGSYLVGSWSELIDVPPAITIVALLLTPPVLQPIQGSVSNAVATVNYSDSVPMDTTIDLELNDSITSGSPQYAVNPPQFDPSSGGVATGDRNRTVRLKVPAGSNAPRSVRITFPFQLSQGTGNGTINANIRLGNIIPPSPIPSPGIIITPPGVQNAVLNINPTPTPSPTPTPTPSPGGGTVGQLPQICIYNGITSYQQLQGMQSRCALRGNNWDFDSCSCTGGCQDGACSPIVIDTAGDGFNLTSNENGVMFDLDGYNWPQQLSWTAPESDDAWLALDRNHNNRIDDGTELFGNASEQPPGQNPKQGFASLGMFDKPGRGGNNDGKITRKDAVFKKLRLWRDRNHNGISEPEELFRLPALDVVAIRLDYAESRRTDQHGNQFKYKARVRDKQGSNVGRWAWDVFLVPAN